jgi:hypothetical protein
MSRRECAAHIPMLARSCARTIAEVWFSLTNHAKKLLSALSRNRQAGQASVRSRPANSLGSPDAARRDLTDLAAVAITSWVGSRVWPKGPDRRSHQRQEARFTASFIASPERYSQQ